MKFYITTAIDYVNAKPHIGHTLEKVQADAIARYHRLQGEDVFFLTGTDDHGFKIAQTAKEQKKPVEKFADINSQSFQKLWKALNISNDYFIRTTNEKRHWPTVRKVWRTLEKNGDLYKKEYSGLYCVGHEAFITQKDLKNGKCQDHDKEPELVQEENYFFKLSKYTKQIKKSIKSGELKIVPDSRRNEILKLLEKGLEDISFSRLRKNLTWGIPVPGDKAQTIYVWADALPNYISSLGWGTSQNSLFKKYWPCDVHVIGKDILRFHAAIWPAILLSLRLPLPKVLLAHGFISAEGRKMSKTIGNVVDPTEIIAKYGADALRWYLLSEIPAFNDGDYSEAKFQERYNADLASGVGNFLARIVGLGERHLTSPLKSQISDRTKREIDKAWKTYDEAIQSFNFQDATKTIQYLIAFGDKRISDIKLWELVQKDDTRFKTEISDLASLLAYVAWMLLPIMPESANQIFKQLGIKPDTKIIWRFKMKRSASLFPRI